MDDARLALPELDDEELVSEWPTQPLMLRSTEPASAEPCATSACVPFAAPLEGVVSESVARESAARERAARESAEKESAGSEAAARESAGAKSAASKSAGRVTEHLAAGAAALRAAAGGSSSVSGRTKGGGKKRPPLPPLDSPLPPPVTPPPPCGSVLGKAPALPQLPLPATSVEGHVSPGAACAAALPAEEGGSHVATGLPDNGTAQVSVSPAQLSVSPMATQLSVSHPWQGSPGVARLIANLHQSAEQVGQHLQEELRRSHALGRSPFSFASGLPFSLSLPVTL